MGSLMIPGYLQFEDTHIAIVALEADLQDIEELERRATGDNAVAFRLQKLEIQDALSILRLRQAARARDLGLPNPPQGPTSMTDPAATSTGSTSLTAPDASSISPCSAALTAPNVASTNPNPTALTAPDASSTSPSSAASSTNGFTATRPATTSSELSNHDEMSASVSQNRFSDSETPSKAGSSVTPAENFKQPRINEDEDHMDRLEVNDSESNGMATVGQTSSNVFPPRKKHKGDGKVCYLKCVACQENLIADSVTKVPCGDQYCIDCIQGLFSASFVDDSLFPPRCCRQHIDPDAIQEFLTADLITAYREKKLEVETLDRTYCSDPRCSIFLKPENITGEHATCPKCNKATCTICKAPRFVFNDLSLLLWRSSPSPFF
jgi:hypothetical protein